MKIYVAHSTGFDYKNELYRPLRVSELNTLHEIILPHEQSSDLFHSKENIKNYDVLLAEVSYPSTGQGIELGWADMYQIPIMCFYKKGAKPSQSLSVISHSLIEYDGVDDMIQKISEFIASLHPQN